MAEIYSYLQLIRQALDETAIIAITDPKGNIIEVNDKFCEISKYSREELIGQNHRIINSRHHAPEFFKDLWETILAGKKWEGEIRNRAKDGSYYWVHTHIIPFKNDLGKIEKFVSIRYDVTPRKRAEQNLTSLLDANLDGLLIYDLSGTITWCNKTAREMFSEVADLQKHSIEELLGKEFQIFTNGEFRISRGQGEGLCTYELVSRSYNYLSRAAYLINIRDISAKVRADAKLIQQDRLASIGVMASGLAHEIGTPLGVVRGRAEIISLTPSAEEGVRAGAEVIMQQIDRISHLVKNLLKLARGEESTSLQKVHLVSLLADIYDFLRHELLKQDIQLEINVDETFEVTAVYTSLFQVFLNLFVNASHAIVERRRQRPGPGLIQVQAAAEDKFLVIQVLDNGCGIGDDEMKKLFTPFFTTKEIGQGTGLGLATSYKLVQGWGGFISVSSTQGEGSCFEIHLPLDS